MGLVESLLLFLVAVWVLKQIYGGRQTATAPPELRRSASHDRFAVNVVGESHYQPALERICGGRSDEGADEQATATLILEDDNPYDRGNAVRVDIGGATVGYLTRDDAKRYRQLLKANAAQRSCPAVIRGGWDRGDDDRGDFGVRLDLDL